MALLVVLVVLLLITASSTSFIGFMNRQQTQAGYHYRSVAALAMAEAGVNQALAVFETFGPDGSPGYLWRTANYSKESSVGSLRGHFTLSLMEEVDGGITIASVGEVGNVRRRLRVRVYLTSPALLAALYGVSLIRLDGPPAETFVLYYGEGTRNQPWVHIAAGEGVWLESRTSLNNRNPLSVTPGPFGPTVGKLPAQAEPVRLLLRKGRELLINRDQQRVGIQQLYATGLNFARELQSVEDFPEAPEIDPALYRAKAVGNAANVSLNRAAGYYLNDIELASKHNSLYSPQQFQALQLYMDSIGRQLRLRGVIYITGKLSLTRLQTIQITDGTLVTEGTVFLGKDSLLEIIHSPQVRTLPGMLVLGDGWLVVDDGARLHVHGLVLTNQTFVILKGAHVDIVGSVLAKDRALSFRNSAGGLIIRYDPAVLGTPGIRRHARDKLVAWVALWEELP